MMIMPDYRPGMNGIIIGLLSSFGSAILIGCFFLIFYFFRCTTSGRIFLDRIGRPGEYDDEQQFLREEAEALETMDDMQRTEYLRAKGKAAVVAVYIVCAFCHIWKGVADAILTFSFYRRQPTRVPADGHFAIPISCHTGEGCVGLGV